MRVIDAFDEPIEPIRTVAVSPDGQFMAAAMWNTLAVYDWVSGSQVCRVPCRDASQVAFGPNSTWLARGHRDELVVTNPRTLHREFAHPGPFSGGVAVSPDGKTLIATRAGSAGRVKAEQWEVPGWRAKVGFDFWSPFTRLAFSPNGEFIAGIGTNRFELRVAVTGGPNGQHRVNYVGDGFFSFSRDSQTVVFGCETDLHVMDTRNGNVVRRVTQPENRAFLDAAFTSSRHFMTVDGTPVLRVWSADSWATEREYDWGCGGLTCVTASPDGLAGVCGTRTGKVVVFDVDE